jgi:hypothetical protein
MTRIVPLLTATLAIGLVLPGCATRVADFTAIATRNIDLNSVRPLEPVMGRHCVPVVLVPLGNPSLEEAVDRAVQAGPAGSDMLTDGVIYMRNRSFLFGSVCAEVSGTATASRGTP